MAKYSIELRKINEFDTVFDFTYTFYNEDVQTKSDFEEKFISAYAFDEIGFETVARFKHYLQQRLNLIMPRYKELYDTKLYEYDPIENYNLTETISATNDTTGSSTQYDTPFQPKTTYEKTPSLIVETGEQLTQGSTRQTSGNIGVQTTQDMIKKQRDIIINIDEMIIKELADLFVGIS